MKRKISCDMGRYSPPREEGWPRQRPGWSLTSKKCVSASPREEGIFNPPEARSEQTATPHRSTEPRI